MSRRTWIAVAALGAVTVASVGTWIALSGGDDGPAEAGIVVKKVVGLPEDFAAGVDVSTVLSLEESGVVFRNADGEPADVFGVLKDSGVTHVRVRVWNDPFDEQGRGYGGGNVGPERATEIARRATDAGLRVLVDFHYSDFWADPAKQMAPKAWEGMEPDAVAAAAGEFTKATLAQMKDAGVDVAMVQVGNETNNGVAGLIAWDAVCAVFNAGAAAVREEFPEALVAVHFANPEQEGSYERIASILDNFEVDYDVFASSYYPFWHGTLENLTTVLSDIATTYDKKVMVAEASWAHTLDDADGYPNVISTAAETTAYAVSAQGQADAVRDVIQAVVDTGAGVGVFYWEPAWLPVGPPEEAAANAEKWEQHGSGWATSFAGSYDAADAGANFGGNGWDNQTLFAPDGTPLESLYVFDYARRGATSALAVSRVVVDDIEVQQGEAVELPAEVTVEYNDRTTASVPVAWPEIAIDTSAEGEMPVAGTLADGTPVALTVIVGPVNDLVNPGFEDDDLSMWELTSDAETFAVVSDNVPAAIGQRVLNFWSGADYTFRAAQTVTGLAPGTYRVAVSGHGADTGSLDANLTLTAVGTEGEWSAPLALKGWQAWQEAVIDEVLVGADGTLTVAVDGALGAEDWGFLDGFELVPIDT